METHTHARTHTRTHIHNFYFFIFLNAMNSNMFYLCAIHVHTRECLRDASTILHIIASREVSSLPRKRKEKENSSSFLKGKCPNSVSRFLPFNCYVCFVAWQKADYPEESHGVFCPNKCIFVTFYVFGSTLKHRRDAVISSAWYDSVWMILVILVTKCVTACSLRWHKQ